MNDIPQITTHYVDGRPSETRDMTEEELAELQPEPQRSEATDETPSPDDVDVVETPEEEP